jgi:hypothetical protein
MQFLNVDLCFILVIREPNEKDLYKNYVYFKNSRLYLYDFNGRRLRI